MFSLDGFKDVSQLADEFLLLGLLAKHGWHLFLEVRDDVGMDLEHKTKPVLVHYQHTLFACLLVGEREMKLNNTGHNYQFVSWLVMVQTI